MLNILDHIWQKGEANVSHTWHGSSVAVTLLPRQPRHQEEPSGERIAKARFRVGWWSQKNFKTRHLHAFQVAPLRACFLNHHQKSRLEELCTGVLPWWHSVTLCSSTADWTCDPALPRPFLGAGWASAVCLLPRSSSGCTYLFPLTWLTWTFLTNGPDTHWKMHSVSFMWT